MGYEIKLYIGKAYRDCEEIARDMSKPYEDGSGFEYQKDKDGNYVKTGRIEKYFSVYAMVDLCKCGYDSKIYDLSGKSHKLANENKDKYFYYFYGSDGNSQVVEDRYGDYMYAMPIKDTIKALTADRQKDEYRRYKWAIALLNSMKDDQENLEVLFFGY